MSDFNYLHSNCFEVTVELGCVKFPPEGALYPLWRHNKEALLHFLESVSWGSPLRPGPKSHCGLGNRGRPSGIWEDLLEEVTPWPGLKKSRAITRDCSGRPVHGMVTLERVVPWCLGKCRDCALGSPDCAWTLFLVTTSKLQERSHAYLLTSPVDLAGSGVERAHPWASQRPSLHFVYSVCCLGS